MTEENFLKSDPERRRYKRFIYEAQVNCHVRPGDTSRSGRMVNFSKGGIYFESDYRFIPGQKIGLGLVAHAEDSGADHNLMFDVNIIWRKNTEGSQFNYGYGGQFLNPADPNLEVGSGFDSGMPALPSGQIRSFRESRLHSRRPYNKSLRFRYNQIEYTGFVANIGRGGALILTDEQFAIGGRTTLIVPGIHTRKKVKVTGRIVRLSPDGIGVRFERRSGRERRGDFDRRTGQDRREWERRQD